jgi:hypothetical protein
MQIKVDRTNDKTKFQAFLKFRRKITKSKASLFLVMVLIVGIIALSSFFYGAYMYYTGRYYHIRMLGYRLLQGDISFVKNSFKSNLNEVDNFDFDIKFKDLEKLRFLREKAISQNYLTNDLQEDIPAKIRFKNDTYKVTISLTGQISEHFRHPEKWSIAVKVKGDKTIHGMKEFALLVPLSRGYMTDWIAHKLLISRNSMGARCDYINVNINGKNHGIYYLEERYDKLLVENNSFREGIIFKVVDNDLKIYNENKIIKNPEMAKQLLHLRKLWYCFLDGEIKSDQLFDLKKLASTAAVSDLMNQKHPLYFSNMRFYFNPVTFLIEPIAREWGVLTKESRMPFESLFPEDPDSPNASAYHKGLLENELINKIYDNDIFYEFYMKEAETISKKNYLDSIITVNKKEYDNLIGKLYIENPFYEFPINILYKNQTIIRNKLHPVNTSLTAYYELIENDSLLIIVKNKAEFPIEIINLVINYKNEIYSSDRMHVKPKHKSESKYQEFKFPLKSKEKIENIEIVYSFLGIQEVRKILVEPRTESVEDYFLLSPTKGDFNVFEIPFVEVNDSLKQIMFLSKEYVINQKVYIPEGYTVSAEPGCIIDLRNSSKIVSYSPLYLYGKSDNLINIVSSDSTGQGIVVLGCDRVSELKFVEFKNLSNVSDNGYNLPSAITFYESPVNIINCNFVENIRGDDYLNAVRTEFNIINCNFERTNADAFDSDFCEGRIEGTNFLTTGNDAIDVSGTRIYINDVKIKQAADKGLSSGEKSEMIVNNAKISESEIAVCSKDQSILKISNVMLENVQIGFTAFQKKPEFGPGIIIASGVKTNNVKVAYLIETHSKLEIDGEEKISDNERVKDQLYGVIYGKASK